MTEPDTRMIDSSAVGVHDLDEAVGVRPLRILSLARSYPSDVFPELGLWTARPTQLVAQTCDVHVISPVPYCPPLPHRGPLREYTRFRPIRREERREGVSVHRPRFVVGPGSSLYRFEARSYLRGITAV